MRRLMRSKCAAFLLVSARAGGGRGGGVVLPHSVPLSEGCQTPFEGFHLQVSKNKHLYLRDSI